jgi:hypothetical protein
VHHNDERRSSLCPADCSYVSPLVVAQQSVTDSVSGGTAFVVSPTRAQSDSQDMHSEQDGMESRCHVH